MISKRIVGGGLTEYTVDNMKDAFFKIIPEKGGLVTSFCANDREVFFTNRTLLESGNDIFAGGLPILFPICGTLTNDAFSVNDKQYKIMDHGFARLLPWTVTQVADNKNALTLELTDNAQTRESYPFSFRCTATFALNNRTLTVNFRLENQDDCVIPFFSGFHPFFYTKNKDALHFDLDAENSYIDYVCDQKKTYDGSIDFSQPVDFLFHLNPSAQYCSAMVDMNDKFKISLETCHAYEYVVLWTEQGQDFVCMEPWMSMPDAMNTKQGLHYVKKSDSLDSWIKIQVSDL